ncbi:uncharacterized protein J3R85_014124 [Psidium guajava]|nr:uncharacterized protein J3R85_014124 [Psidium guajava]
MAKLSFAQFFVFALVFTATCVWPHAAAERKCSEYIEFEKCTNGACVAKCKSNHGGSFRHAACVHDEVGDKLSCECYYHC